MQAARRTRSTWSTLDTVFEAEHFEMLVPDKLEKQMTDLSLGYQICIYIYISAVLLCVYILYIYVYVYIYIMILSNMSAMFQHCVSVCISGSC